MNALRRVAGLCIALLVSALFGSELRAEVARMEVTSRVPVAGGRAFGKAGAYERIIGRVFFSVDISNPRNRGIVDLDKAANLKDGRVAFSASVIVGARPGVGAGADRLVPGAPRTAVILLLLPRDERQQKHEKKAGKDEKPERCRAPSDRRKRRADALPANDDRPEQRDPRPRGLGKPCVLVGRRVIAIPQALDHRGEDARCVRYEGGIDINVERQLRVRLAYAAVPETLRVPPSSDLVDDHAAEHSGDGDHSPEFCQRTGGEGPEDAAG